MPATGESSLSWVATLTNTDFKKGAEEIIELNKQMLQSAAEASKGLDNFTTDLAAGLNVQGDALKNGILSSLKETSSIAKDQAQSIAQSLAIPDISNTVVGVDGLKRSLESIGDSRVAISGVDELIRVLNEDLEKGRITSEQLKESLAHIATNPTDTGGAAGNTAGLTGQETLLSSISQKYRELLQNGLSAYAELSPATKESYERLRELEQELKATAAAEKELTEAFKAGYITAEQYDGAELAVINQQKVLKQVISEVNNELKANQAAELQNLGSIASKEAALGRLQAEYKNLSARERESVEIGKAMRTQIAGLTSEISALNSMGNSGGIGKLLGSIQSIAGSFGIFLGAYQLVQFGKDLFEIQKQASGIEAAFARLGNSNLLGKLRDDTKGFIADLDLERLAVKANNFNIPLEKLGTFLLFASQRAKDTGQDVNKLTNNIIDGLGRKSARIIDNLGISLVDIQAEFKKTGDFTSAVSNLIQKEMQQSGASVDTLADKTNRASASWENFKKFLASGFDSVYNTVFNPSAADTGNITKLTETTLKKLSDFGTRSATDRQKTIDQQASEVQRLSTLYLKVKNEQTGLFSGREKDQINNDRKSYGEQLVAAKNVLTTLKEQSAEADKQLRTRKGILSVTELAAKAANLKDEANNIIPNSKFDTDRRSSLLKQAADIQKQIDEISGKAEKKRDKADESAAKKRAAALARELEERKRLLDDISDLESKYAGKNLSREDAEVAAIEREYDIRKRKIEEFNAKLISPKDKISTQLLDDSKTKAVETARENQSFDYYKEDLDKQKQLFDQFEQYKLKVGSEKAEQRFAKELNGNQSFIDYLDKELSADRIDPNDKTKATADRKAYLEKMKSDAQQAQAEQLTALLEGFKSYQTQIENLTAIHNDKVKILANNPDALKAEELSYQQQLDALKSSQSDRIGQIEGFNNQVIELSRKQAKAQIQALQEAKAGDTNITPAQNADIDSQIAKLQAAMSTTGGLNKAYQAELLRNKQILIDQLVPLDTTSKKYKEIVAAIAKIDEELKGNGPTEFEKKMAKVSADANAASQGFSTLSNSLAEINPGLSDTLATLSEITKTLSDGAQLAGSIAKGDPVGIITGVANVASDLIGLFTRGKKSAEESAAVIKKYSDDLVLSTYEYNILLREQKDLQKELTGLTSQQLKDRIALLSTSNNQAKTDYDTLLKQIQTTGQQITGYSSVKYGGFLGAFQKTKTVANLAGLGDADYDKLNELYVKGQLTDSAKTLFEELKKVHDQMDGIADAAQQAKDQLDQVATGTTADQMASAIFDGIKKGFRSIDDFLDDQAGNFANVIRAGIDSGFEKNYLQSKINDFYKIYAEAAENGDLEDPAKVAALKAQYAKVISDAGKVYDEQTKVFGAAVTSTTSANNQAAAIKGITQDQANILSGTLNGMRVAYIQTNALLNDMNGTQLKYLEIGMGNLRVLNQIEYNTRQTAANTKDSAQGINDTVSQLKDINQNTRDSFNVAMRAAGKFNY